MRQRLAFAVLLAAAALSFVQATGLGAGGKPRPRDLTPVPEADAAMSDAGELQASGKLTDMDDDGPASEAVQQPGDVLLHVDGVRVQSAAQLRTALANAGGEAEVVFINAGTGLLDAVRVAPRHGRTGTRTEPVEVGSDGDE
jgi:S1-C subfamily serine protease